MKVFFADTFYWIALTNPKDAAHREVMEFTTKLGPRSVITTDEVLTELLAYCASSAKLRREVGLAVLGCKTIPIFKWFRRPETDSSRAWHCTTRGRTKATASPIVFPCRLCAGRGSPKRLRMTGISNKKDSGRCSARPDMRLGNTPPGGVQCG
jgi:hypothetical protein